MFTVRIVYRSRGGPLEGASQVPFGLSDTRCKPCPAQQPLSRTSAAPARQPPATPLPPAASQQYVCVRVFLATRQVWAHVGHSGWLDTADVQLVRGGPGDGGNGNHDAEVSCVH